MSDPDDLAHAAAVVRAAMSHDRRTQPGGRWSPGTWALVSELTDEVHALLVPDQPRRCAEMAVDAWIITGRPLATVSPSSWSCGTSSCRRRDGGSSGSPHD